MSVVAENKNKVKAMTFTIGFHALLFLLFIFIVFVTPIPPFEIKPSPEIEISLGMEGLGNKDAGGSGKKDLDIKTTQQVASPRSHHLVSHVTASAPHIITDETETSTHVKSNPKNNTKQHTSETSKVEEPKPSAELLNALTALKNKKETCRQWPRWRKHRRLW